RGEGQPGRLRTERGHDPRVAVSVVQRGVRREHVQIPLPLDIPDPYTLAAGQDDGEREIVVRAPAFALGDEIRGPRLALHHGSPTPMPGTSGTPHSGHCIGRNRNHSSISAGVASSSTRVDLWTW